MAFLPGTIDIHAHIGTYAGYDLSLPTLLSNLDQYRISLALISNIDGANLPETGNLNETRANAATLEVVRRHPDKFRGLAWTRPNDGDPKHLLPFLQDTSLSGAHPKAFVGMKFHPMMNQFPADSTLIDPYLTLCEQYHIPAVFHCDKPGTNGGPEKIYASARRHPNVPIILYHMVFFGPHAPAVEVVAQSLRDRDADLYLETAQAQPEDVLKAIRTVGEQRVMFGTDATYFGKDHYQKYEGLVELLKKELSLESFHAVMGNNARRVFQWE